MASITIRNLDDDIKQRLRIRAAMGADAPPRDLAAAIRGRARRTRVARPRRDARAASRRLAAQDGATVYFTAVGEAELRHGLALLPAGKRRNALTRSVDAILGEDFRDRILPFDRMAAGAYAVIAAERRYAGRPISQFDCQIAAVARAHGATLATRNTSDFQGCGVDLINPWEVGGLSINDR